MATIKTNDIETYYERRGDGPPIVFVHGAALNHTQWDPQMDALSDDYTTVAYDVRGHGHTGGSDVGTYSFGLLAADLDALISGLDVERPVVCGLSMGGAIAQVYAATYPDRVSGLVLADTFAAARLGVADRLVFGSLRIAIPAVRLLGLERVQRLNAWLYERGEAGSSGDFDAVEALQAEAPPMTTAEFAKVFRALAAFHRADIDLSSITVPTAILYGEHTPGPLRKHAGKLAAEIPDATIQVVPGGGHACNVDNPEFFNERLRALLSRAFPDQ